MIFRGHLAQTLDHFAKTTQLIAEINYRHFNNNAINELVFQHWSFQFDIIAQKWPIVNSAQPVTTAEIEYLALTGTEASTSSGLNLFFTAFPLRPPVYTASQESKKRYKRPVILDLCLRRTRSGNHMIIVALSFSKAPAFSISSGLKSVFEKLRFRDGLEIEIELCLPLIHISFFCHKINFFGIASI